MSHYGIIFTAYNAQPYVVAALSPWIEAAKNRLGGHRWTICAVSSPFEHFPQSSSDDTREVLKFALSRGDISHLIKSDVPVKETDARGAALSWLLSQKVQLIWQVDADELYTTDQIDRIVEFVEGSPLVTWFRVCLRNHVFNEKTYLVEPFSPPRIHRVEYAFRSADRFYEDNGIEYKSADGSFIADFLFPNALIPKGVAWIRHMSWLSDERSKRKCEYQWARWGKCTFAWDESKGLVWRGLPQATAQEE